MLNVLIALGIFGTILLFMQGCVLLHRVIAPRGVDRAIERLQSWSKPEVLGSQQIIQKEHYSDIAWLNEILHRIKLFQPLRTLYVQTDCPLQLGSLVMATPLLALGALALASASNQPPVLAVLFVAVLGAMPTIYLHWLKHKRIAKLVRQLPDTFELISRSLRAGHAFSVGLKLVGDEAPDPVGLEFRRAFDEVAMGVALPKALENITNRVDSLDLRFFVTAVVVQRETGGNLAEIIDSLAAMIRRRFELQMKVNALSAEGRFSGMILFGLPIVIGLLLFEMNPEYIGLLFTDPIGQNLVMIGSFLMVTGAIVMKRLIAIRV